MNKKKMMSLKKPLTLGRSNKSPRKRKKGNDPVWSQSRRKKEKITSKKLKKLDKGQFYIHIDGNVYRKKTGQKLPLHGLSQELRKEKKDWKKIREITKGLPVVIHGDPENKKKKKRKRKNSRRSSSRSKSSSSSSSSLPPDLEPIEMATYVPE